jgi:hypothetical protein
MHGPCTCKLIMKKSLLSRLLMGATSLLFASSALANQLVPLWQIEPNTEAKPYIDGANLTRGIAYDPVSNVVAVATRSGGARVILLDATTGSDGSELPEAIGPRTLLGTDAFGDGIIAGGTFPLNLVGAAQDGAIYAVNLATSTNQPVRIYRWARADINEPVSLAYGESPLVELNLPADVANDGRFGDTLAVRGSGTSTEILLSARTGRYLLVFRTQDGVTFSVTGYTTDIPSGGAGLGLAWGKGNTVFTKSVGQPMRHLELVEASKTARTVTTYSTAIAPTGGANLGTDSAANRLAIVDTSGHTVRVLDISNPAAPIQIGTPLPFPSANANGNGTGAAAFSDNAVFALDTNNGLIAANIEINIEPPSVATPPVGGNPYTGTSFTFSVGAQGTPPLFYQWLFEDAVIPGATQGSLTLTNLALSQSGRYSVVISNAVDSVTSANATLTVRAPFSTPVLTPAWNILPGSRDTVNTDSTQRGLAVNPLTGNVLYVSRSGGNRIVVLDPATGTEKHRLATTDFDGFNIVSGGTIPANMIAVSADGFVYLANLNLPAAGAGALLRVYVWPSDAPDITPEFIEINDLPSDVRFGDTLAVRGTGGNTELLLSSRSSTSFAIVTLSGFTATSRIYSPADVAPGAFGLGITFGPGNSVFGTAAGQPVVHVAFNPATGEASVARTYAASIIPNSVAHLAFDAPRNLLAATALETPDNILLYSLANLDTPVLLDQELLPVDNANVNGTGAIGFGGDRLFALNSNNGIHAYTINLTPAVAPTLTATLNGANLVISVAEPGTFNVESTATPFSGWTTVGTVSTAQPFTTSAANGNAFFRAVAR